LVSISTLACVALAHSFSGYWLAIYEGIAFSDHFLYKRRMIAYDPAIYDQSSKLPPGIAAIFAFCCGIAGMVVGMSQVWFVGPIALKAGEAPYGGDVGFELGFAFAFVSYAVARRFELKYFGR
jgi:purine-cytosine permease-like protein